MKLNFIGLLAIVAMPMANAASVDTCDMQEPCVDWTMSKLDSSTCELGGDCTVEVCMIVDKSRSDCDKDDTFSHMCDQTDSDGCPAWNDASEPTFGTGTAPESCDGQISEKCEGFAYVKMCQEGVAGQILYWILKDGSTKTIETQKEYSFTYDTECDAEVSCVNNLETCGGGTNQQLLERTWMFKIPDTTGSCDICGSVDPPVDTPVDPVAGATTSGSLRDPQCK
jgi:hypothetical protein